MILAESSDLVQIFDIVFKAIGAAFAAWVAWQMVKVKQEQGRAAKTTVEADEKKLQAIAEVAVKVDVAAQKTEKAVAVAVDKTERAVAITALKAEATDSKIIKIGKQIKTIHAVANGTTERNLKAIAIMARRLASKSDATDDDYNAAAEAERLLKEHQDAMASVDFGSEEQPHL